MNRGAEVSACGLYRHLLWRTWDASLPGYCAVLLNPSTADAEEDDPTSRKLVGFGRRWGYGSVVVVNAFQLRTPYPADLLKVIGNAGEEFAVGPRADHYILAAVAATSATFAAWGGSGGRTAAGRLAAVAELIEPSSPFCIGTTKGGAPKHPSRPAYASPVSRFSAGTPRRGGPRGR